MKRQNGYRTIAGFTMIELLVAMLVGSILATGIVAVFIHQTRAMALQEDLVDLEQNLRIGMNFLVRDVRMAGLYSGRDIPAFDIGDIDCNGDGIHGDCRSEGVAGGPNAIATQLSDKPGIKIVDSTPGANIIVYYCSDDPLKDPLAPPTGTVPLFFSDQTFSKELQIVNNKISQYVGAPNCCPPPSTPANPTRQCSSIVFPQGLTSGHTPAVGGHVWSKIEYTVYSVSSDYNCDGIPDGDAALIRQMGGVCSVVAFGINDLRATYILDDGYRTPIEGDAGAPVDAWKKIRRVELLLTGQTRNPHAISSEPDKRPKRTLSTEVQVRNLFY